MEKNGPVYVPIQEQYVSICDWSGAVLKVLDHDVGNHTGICLRISRSIRVGLWTSGSEPYIGPNFYPLTGGGTGL